MVSWSEDSNKDAYQYDDSVVKIPATTEDSDFEGPETDILVLCHEHGKPANRHVAFEGILTGRRFLACAEKEGKNCGLVEWIDQAWPATPENGQRSGDLPIASDAATCGHSSAVQNASNAQQ